MLIAAKLNMYIRSKVRTPITTKKKMSLKSFSLQLYL